MRGFQTVMRGGRILRCLLLASLAAGCGGALTPVTVPGAGGATIPRGAVDALKARWPKVELGASRQVPCAASSDQVPMLTGDFNGDGMDDAVVWITSEGTAKLVAAIARLGGEYTVIDLGDASAASVAAMEVARRGSAYRLTSLTIDSYFGLDTIILRDCSGARTAYFWTGSAFLPEAIAN